MKLSPIHAFLLAILTAAILAGCERQPSAPAARAAESQSPANTVNAAVSAVASAEVKPYPLNVCIVSDEELDSMGKPVSLVYEGQEYRFCCDSCPVAFKKEPQKYVAKLAAAVAAKASVAGQPPASASIQSQQSQ